MTASAEDLVILKAFAGRHQDWSDVEGITVRQGDGLDWGDIITEAEILQEIAESPDMVQQLSEIRRNVIDG